jgi:hypothetical protein
MATLLLAFVVLVIGLGIGAALMARRTGRYRQEQFILDTRADHAFFALKSSGFVSAMRPQLE